MSSDSHCSHDTNRLVRAAAGPTSARLMSPQPLHFLSLTNLASFLLPTRPPIHLRLRASFKLPCTALGGKREGASSFSFLLTAPPLRLQEHGAFTFAQQPVVIYSSSTCACQVLSSVNTHRACACPSALPTLFARALGDFDCTGI